MARQTVFQRWKSERGQDWPNKLNPDEIIRMSENILQDIAYGRLYSNEDKWFLVSEPVINALISFCDSRCRNLEYLVRCMQQYRDIQTQYFNNGDNAVYSYMWENVSGSYALYSNIKYYLEQYKLTGDPTCMIGLYSLFDESKHKGAKNLIFPNRYI